jgi:hypothetical protein
MGYVHANGKKDFSFGFYLQSEIIEEERIMSTVKEFYWHAILRGRRPERNRFWVTAHGDDYDRCTCDLDWPELVQFVADRQRDVDRMQARLATDTVWDGIVEHHSPYEPEACEIALRVTDVGACAVAQLDPVTESGAAHDALAVVPHWRRADCKPESVEQYLTFLTSAERSKVTAALVTGWPRSATEHLVVTLSAPTDCVAYGDFQLVLARAVLGWLSDRNFPKAVSS